MATDPSTLRGVVNSAIIGFCLIALACGFHAAFSPTVRVNCPARTAAAPDCELRWLVAFDRLTVRYVPLPGLGPVGEIVKTAPSRSGGATTLYLDTTAGRVRTILWGGHPVELQGLRDPLRAYLANPQAGPIELTMWPSEVPIRLISNSIVAVGLLYWVSMPFQLAGILARRLRS